MEETDLMPALEDEVRRFDSDGIAWLRFSPRLEDKFHAEVGPLRARALLVQGLFALLVYDFFLVGDFLVAPHQIVRAAVVRLAIFTPLALLGSWLALVRRSDFFRETTSALLCCLAAFSVLYLHHGVDTVVTLEAEMGVMVILLVMNCLLRVDLTYAVVASFLIAGMNAAWLFSDPLISSAQKLVAGGLLAWVTVLTIAGNYIMSRERRFAYLLQLQSRMQHTMLEKANAELLAISSTDKLTGLPNRHAYDSRFTEMWRLTAASGAPLSAVMVDVDHFKILNDTYGHPYGDRVLKRVASLLQQAMRAENDFVVRYGGEEFLVLLPGADQPSAVKVAERIRTLVQVAGSPALQRDSHSSEVFATVSCGVATLWPRNDADPSRLIAEADAAMYRAKQEGRNRVCWAPLSAPASKAKVFPMYAGRN